MRKYRKWRDIVIAQLAADWDAAIDYIQFALEEYQVDGDTPVLLLSLKTFIESQGGIAEVAKHTGMAPETLSKILSSEDAPPLDTFVTILKALGCRLSIELLKDEDFQSEKIGANAPIASSEGIKPDMVLATDNK
ncbi:helix-turn-helix domain-containing protein [Candidatus Poribacteria bacterium]|nr:helix-turn-helix domain-containing protein [Candidatus Poribacteria bacterium]MXY28478.1 helix-turn-helix domain-containing protein [Candidatus Poribacteria bacterium]MYK16996.1 helix-turn-helix domain-containing protein [Candidatus Poribacteria bacterium]